MKVLRRTLLLLAAAAAALPTLNSAAGCGRRVFQLYLSRVLAPRLQFLCRHCTGLVYTSKYERPWRRASRRASKLRQRLGITGLGVPEKPKDMPVPRLCPFARCDVAGRDTGDRSRHAPASTACGPAQAAVHVGFVNSGSY